MYVGNQVMIKGVDHRNGENLVSGFL